MWSGAAYTPEADEFVGVLWVLGGPLLAEFLRQRAPGLFEGALGAGEMLLKFAAAGAGIADELKLVGGRKRGDALVVGENLVAPALKQGHVEDVDPVALRSPDERAARELGLKCRFGALAGGVEAVLAQPAEP